ncbi:fumarylacetoacetate hydrolase family protein [Yoonia sp. R2331]|uniref:fumarylacetoacetate hydrolase family protein n=1 Tax=Yoonia sp. R2331 TaxID=3237238 RepID=UPI0034E3C947
MRFGTALVDDKRTAIVQGTDGLARKLSDVCALAGLERSNSVLDFVEQGLDPQLLGPHIDAADPLPEPVNWVAPLPNPSKILGVAFNNVELMKKAHVDPGVPNFFLKPPSSLQGHRKPVIVDPAWGAVIPEPEICAVIKTRCKHITEDEALDHVFGFLIHNDVTSHGLKFQKDSIAVTYDKDMARPEFYGWRNLNGPDDTDAFYVYHTRSKGTDTFGPMGPWITTTDVVGDPNDLHLTGWLDDEKFTSDHTSSYRFSVEQCIAEASRYFTLEPGDLISFGTTGKGAGRFPRGHKSLLMGEETGVVAIEVEPLGRLENPILHQKGGA